MSKGTGLGLFISYNLMTEIGGAIELQSTPGVGMTVVLGIPVRPPNDLVPGPAPGPSPAGRDSPLDEPCY